MICIRYEIINFSKQKGGMLPLQHLYQLAVPPPIVPAPSLWALLCLLWPHLAREMTDPKESKHSWSYVRKTLSPNILWIENKTQARESPTNSAAEVKVIYVWILKKTNENVFSRKPPSSFALFWVPVQIRILMWLLFSCALLSYVVTKN